MKLKESQKILKCVAGLAYEKDLCTKFVTPIVKETADHPVLNESYIEIAKHMMGQDRQMNSIGFPGLFAAVYAMNVHRRNGLYFESSSDEKLIIGGIAKNGRLFSVQELQNNPYVKAIKIPEASIGNDRYSFTKYDYDPYELFLYDSPVQSGNYGCIDIPKIGFFDKRWKFVTLNEGRKAWMSITPNEICTMKDPIKNAHGKVLTLGLGLGYFAYMAAIKGNVESVTIVERDPDIIKLFSDHILSQFGKAENKIKIIQSDAIEYVNALEDGDFDYCFADIWDGSSLNQMDIYMKCREALRKFTKTDTEFWINDSFISALHEVVVIGVINEGYSMIGAPLIQCENYGKELGRMEKYVNKVMEDVVFNSAYDLKRYTSYEYIDEAIRRTRAVY